MVKISKLEMVKLGHKSLEFPSGKGMLCIELPKLKSADSRSRVIAVERAIHLLQDNVKNNSYPLWQPVCDHGSDH